MWIRLILLSLLASMLWVSPAPAGADDYNRIIKLEQDVRNLERQVNDLKRQVDVLNRQEPSVGAASSVRSRGPQSESVSSDAPPWYSRANWDRVKVGMNELDVIGLLGKPNTLRTNDAESTTLLYALEIGSGAGFLSGSIDLKDHRVLAVNKPVLK